MDLIYFLCFCPMGCGGYSSVVERLTAHKEVPGSNLGVTFGYGGIRKNQCLDFKSRQLKRLKGSNPSAPFGLADLKFSNQGSI